MNKSILIVEDELRIRFLLRDYLMKENFNVFEASDGEEGLIAFSNQKIDLVILDIMMPKMDGITMLEKLREVSTVPVILLTAKGEEEDKLQGYDYGADDYITKPFNPLELTARVKSQLRRYINLGDFSNTNNSNDTNYILKSGGLELNTDTKIVSLDGEEIKMTPLEYKILTLLMSRKGKIFSSHEIYENVWNEDAYSCERTIAVHIRRIREKIEINPKEPKYLKVVWGIGYKIEKLNY